MSAASPESELEALSNQLQIELRIRNGAQHLLTVFNSGAEVSPGGSNATSNASGGGQSEALRRQVQSELQTAEDKIDHLEKKISDVQQQDQLLSVNNNTSTSKAASQEDLVFHDAHETLPSDDGRHSPQPSTQQPDTGSPGHNGLPPTHQAVQWLEQIQQHSADQTQGSSELLHALENFSSIMLSTPPLAHLIDPGFVCSTLLPLVGDDWNRDVRATAHQAIRYWCCTFFEGVRHFQDHHFDWFIIRSLSRDSRCDLEKQQALLTVRSLVQLTHVSGVQLVAVGVVRAIVAIAENGEDKLRYVALESLAELAIRDVALLDSADGLRVLLHALIDGPYELAPSIAQVFIYLVDRPHLRAYLHSGLDLEIAFSGLTMGYAKGAAQEERVRSSARVIVLFLKSWPGLIYSCSNNMRSLHSLVGALAAPSLLVQETVLDTFFEIFRIQTPEWLNPFVSGKRLTLFRKAPVKNSAEEEETARPGTQGTPKTFNMVDQWLRIVLWAFLRSGLIDALVKMVEQQHHPKMGRKAAVLMGETLQLASRLLPTDSVTSFTTLPRLFKLATDYSESGPWFAATSALGSVDSVSRKLRRSAPQTSRTTERRARSNSLEVESTKVRMGMAIDDASFRNMLVETQVLTQKEYSRWNFDIIMELLEGPLMNPRRLEETLKGSKLLRRLASFFHPSEHRYSALSSSPNNLQYTRYACIMLTTLLASQEGIRFLAEDKLFRQVTDSLMALENSPSSGKSTAGDNIFSKTRLATTASSGYFEMIGTLTKYEEGLKLLERFKIFTSLYRATDLEERDDMIRYMIDNFDYTINGHTRVVLSKALTHSSQGMRLYATHKLARLLKTAPPPVNWLINMLVLQLYDTSAEVRNLTVHILEEACQSPDILHIVVELRPSLDHLGYAGAPLLFLFMSTSLGLSYLNELKYVEQSMEEWYIERNEQYVVQVETHVARLLNVDGARPEEDSLRTTLSGNVPPHFYGELVKTPEGCQVLEEKGHFLDFADYIRDHGLEDQDLEGLLRLKSILWAVGHIGACSGGLPFLESEGVIASVVEIASSSLCLSIRGTCCFVLGLISTTTQGSDILDEVGWQSASPNGSDIMHQIGCVPDAPAALCQLSTKLPESASSTPRQLPPPQSPVERQVCLALVNLSNHLLATAASKTLTRIQNRAPHIFKNPALFFRALYMMDHNHYRLPVRRYIMDLFAIPFTHHQLDEVFEQGARLQAAAFDLPRDVPDNIASARKRSSSLLSGSHYTWPSGQSSMLRAGLWSDDEDEDVDEAALPPKETLNPIVKIEGFLC